MIEIDKTDFLYKYLTKLGAENIDELYMEYANNGVSNVADFKKYLYSKYADVVEAEVDEEELKSVVEYYGDIKKIKKISASELNKLLKQYKNNPDEETYSRIINSQLKDILFIAYLYKMKFKEYELLDIIQVCNLGLMKAIEKYDEKARIAFSDYIDFWINQEINATFTRENK